MIQYDLAISRRETAQAMYNMAGLKLDLMTIRERLAEIKSQTEPLDRLLKQKMDERERLYAVAFYVVVGRWPEKEVEK